MSGHAFTVYRHNMDSRETHSAMHKNPGRNMQRRHRCCTLDDTAAFHVGTLNLLSAFTDTLNMGLRMA
jgi:hypothetical protein